MFRRSRSGARRSRRARSNQSTSTQRTYRRKPLFELLEDRRMLAVTITVNTNLDTVSAADGVTSLREAITTANADTGDTIQFAPSLNGATIALSNLGELKITSAMTIDATSLAGGLTVKAFDNSSAPGDGTRIFNVDDGNAAAINVSLNGLTLTGGDVVGAGGAILSKENLNVVSSTVTGNAATLDGAGIASSVGQLYLIRTTVSNNTSALDGGGVYQNSGTLTLNSSTIAGNKGRLGGGINATSITATINNSTISANTAVTGAGLFSSASATTINDSTISGNSASNMGGGIWANVVAGSPLTILYSTITRNTSNSDSTGGGSGGGIYLGPGGGTATLKNTIVAGNNDLSAIAPDIDNTSAATHPTLTVNFDLIGNAKGSGLTAANPDANGNRIGSNTTPINPQLGPLTNNGGPTKTHSLLAGSLAINNGDPAAVAGGGAPLFDQRGSGFPRIVGGRLDIGSFELSSPVTQSTFALLNSSDTGMFNNDHVTNKMQPAFGGVGPALSTVYVYAQATDSTGAPTGEPFIIGTGTVGSDPTAGTTNDGFGAWEVTVEPMGDGKWLFYARFDTTVVPVEGPVFHVLSDPVGNAPVTLTPIDVPKNIPNGPSVTTSNIVIGGGGGGAGASVETKYVASLTVTVNITYPHTGDLTLYLIGPNGTSVLLANMRGGAGANFTNTTFDDNATISITSGAATPPFTGTFQPEDSLSAFTGDPLNGPWTLEVINNASPGSTGTLVSWSLAIESSVGVVIDTVAPNQPFLDLVTFSDSGRNNADNVTKTNTPEVSMTSSDPNGQFAQLLFTDNLKFRIYDRFVSSAGSGAPEVLIYDSAQDPDADAISNANDMFTSATQLSKIMPFLKPASPGITADGKLADGIHNFKLVVEDRAGNISHEYLQTITVDTATPPVSFGLPDATNATDGLMASSDSGVTTIPATYADRITNVTTPTFWGQAEANTIVRLFYDKNADGKIQVDGPNADIYLGQATAIPLDGNVADPVGYWQITSALDLNQIVGVPKDGLRRLLVTAEDVAGNPTPTGVPGTGNDFHEIIPVGSLQIFIDTQGPQITGVTPNNSDLNLFALKQPGTGTPTPLVTSLKIAFKDLPSRADSADANNKFLYDALVSGIAQTAGNYVLVGDHVGTIAIQSITVNNSNTNQITGVTLTGAQTTTVLTATGLVSATPQPEVGDYILITSGAANGQVRRITAYNSATGAMTLDIALPTAPVAGDTLTITKAATATVTLNFASPLPDDRYTLTVKDNLVDPANNKLDGESHQIEPQGPLFPTGDGVPGGNFVARFTVDSHPEIGNYVSQQINIDINGDFVWDPANAQTVGDTTDDDLSFTLQVQNAAGATAPGGFNVHDLLFAGMFTRTIDDGDPFDQLAAFGNAADLGGVFRWLIDTNSDGVITLGTDILNTQPTLANFSIAGAIPVAGNFDNNTANGDEIGLYNAGKWALDTNHNFVIDAGDTFINSTLFGTPIVGDFDGDGKVDLAVFNNNVFSFDLANNGFGTTDATMTWGFPGVLDKPVAADMDGDGITDIGLWVPRTDATNPAGVAQWYFLVSNDFTTVNGALVPAAHTPGSIAKINHAFSPTPLGHDLFAEFGDERSLPIVGNFDPPLSPAAIASLGKSMGDFDGNGKVEQADYNVWRSTFGSTTNLAADANHDGIVDSGDYSMWRDHMGQSVPGAGSGAESLQAVQLQVLAPASSDSAPTQAVQAAASPVAPPSTSTPSTAITTTVETAAAPVNVDQLDRALLLLFNETPTAIPAPSEAPLAPAPDGQNQEDDAATTDSETLAVVWQSWGSL